MAKRVLIILAEGFEDVEGIGPADILQRGGVEVVTAGLTAKEVKGSRGVTVIADTTLDKAGIDFDAVYLPGGSDGAKNLAASKTVTELIRSFNSSGRIVSAICAAPAVVLSPTGILKGKSVTCFPGLKDKLDPAAKYLTDRVVVDGNLITSQALGTTLEFAVMLLERLTGKENAERVRAQALI